MPKEIIVKSSPRNPGWDITASWEVSESDHFHLNFPFDTDHPIFTHEQAINLHHALSKYLEECAKKHLCPG